MTEIEEHGAEAVIDRAIEEALDGPDSVYLSLDIDVIDPGMAPGTGTPEPGGMLTREVLRAVRRIVGKVSLAGMDVVEVSPPYDHADVTAMAAHRAVLEAISALAVRKRDGHAVRHEPVQPNDTPEFRVEEEVIDGELARGSATSGAVLRGEGTPRGGG
jgi:agmatinase